MDGITYEIQGDAALVARFHAIDAAAQPTIARKLLALMILGQEHVQRDKLSGQVLKNRTGHLRASVISGVAPEGDGLLGFFGVPEGPTAAYGKVHEFGGVFTVREHDRRVTQVFGRVLEEETVAHVRAHEATFPERSFLRTAFAELRPQIEAELGAAVTETLRAT